MKRLRFTAQALQDFQDIHDYIAKDNVDAAFEFIERLQERCNEVCHMPGIGRTRDELAVGLRSAAVGDYLIFYRRRPRVRGTSHRASDLGSLPRKSLTDQAVPYGSRMESFGSLFGVEIRRISA